MHTYRFFWMNGLYSDAKGHTVSEAFNKATIKNPHELTDILTYKELN